MNVARLTTPTLGVHTHDTQTQLGVASVRKGTEIDKNSETTNRKKTLVKSQESRNSV